VSLDLSEDKKITNKIIDPVVLITGSAKRIGAAIAKHLHADGYKIAIHHHTSIEEAYQLEKELNNIRPDSAFAVQQDLVAKDAARKLIKSVVKKANQINLLVNNASIFLKTPLNQSDNIESSWDLLHTINLRVPYLLSLEAMPFLRVTGGSIVNITDIHSERPRKNYSAYCASKAALVAASNSLAIDLAPDVRVNCVAPGAIVWASSEDQIEQNNVIDSTPLARVGNPLDIAQAVSYLAQAKYVTGHVLNVDGGRTLNA
jgi:pteridine reductase